MSVLALSTRRRPAAGNTLTLSILLMLGACGDSRGYDPTQGPPFVWLPTYVYALFYEARTGNPLAEQADAEAFNVVDHAFLVTLRELEIVSRAPLNLSAFASAPELLKLGIRSADGPHDIGFARETDLSDMQRLVALTRLTTLDLSGILYLEDYRPLGTLRYLECLKAPFPASAELQALTGLRILVLRGLPEPTLQEELLLMLRRALLDCNLSVARTE